MKEIKFRQAIFSKGKFSHWHYWGFIGGSFVGPETGMSSVEEALKNSQQFTNYYTEDEKEIWEKDIIQYDEMNEFIAEVKFENGCYCASDTSCDIPLYELKYRGIKIIGNTTENPDLGER